MSGSQANTDFGDGAPRRAWQNVEFVGGGFITGIAQHPTEPGLMYARTDVGGAYRYAAEQGRWLPITDFIGQDHWPWTGVESVALDPRDPERVYLALGIYNQPRFGPAVIARSSNAGRSFCLAEVPFGMGGNEAGRGSGERLLVDPNASRVLWFGSRDRGLWRSEDAGESFRRVTGFPDIDTRVDAATLLRHPYMSQPVGVVFLLADARSGVPGSPTPTLYAGVSVPGHSLFRSLDAGRTWQPVPGQPAGLRPIRAALSAEGTLFVSYGSEPGPDTMHDGAVYRYDTERELWTNITPDTPAPDQGRPFGYAGVAVDAQHPSTLMVTTAYRDHAQGYAGDEVFRSTDGGATWRAIGTSPRRDVGLARWLRFGRAHAHVGHWMYALSIDPCDSRCAYYATGQTLWRCSNLDEVDRGGVPSWTQAARGIEQTVPLSLASPGRGARVFVGLGDISGFTVTDPEAAGTHVHMLEPTFKDTSSIDYAHDCPELVVRVGSRGWDRQRDRDTGAFSEDGGTTWHAFAAYPSQGAELGSIAVSAAGSVWVWGPGLGGIYRTLDRAKSWNECRGAPDAPAVLLADRVRSQVCYAHARGLQKWFRSEDHAASFCALDVPWLAGGVTAAVASFRCAGRVWVAADGHLYGSTNGGERWLRVSGIDSVSHVALGLPQGPTLPESLFAAGRLGKDWGIFKSSDAGETWTPITDAAHQFGQIRVLCGDQQQAGRVYVATGGRGLLFNL